MVIKKQISKLFTIILISHVNVSYTHSVDYYPSQSIINKKTYENVMILSNETVSDNKTIKWRNFQNSAKIKREVDPVFHGHPKTKEEQWNDNFLNKAKAFDQIPSLITLIHKITLKYLNDCIPVIMYDSAVSSNEGHLFTTLLQDFPVTYVHGKIGSNNKLINPNILKPVHECVHYVVFLTDVNTCAKVIGMQSSSKVVVVARTSQWAVHDFLSGPLSRKFVNLLVISQSFKDDNDGSIEVPYILYTHKLYIDGLGASQAVVLTSWMHGKFSREVDLFPPKITDGYAGHRFMIAAAHQPPFVIRSIKRDLDGGNPRVVWDGLEIRILKLLAEVNNFSIEITEPQDLQLGPGDAVTKEITSGKADIGVAGMYMTIDRSTQMDMAFSHSQDCAVFITLMSTALPRYRAILGPFHWHVWVALTLTYLFGILPLAFSDKHTLRHLLENGGEVENMFWYVFGTFTNCFTFVGKNSWSRTDKITTRLLIGWYWIFTIIITSCYTGSIIAFVTLPVFPETIDTIEQLLKGFYRLGTLDHGGWERWFLNSSDAQASRLLTKLQFVPDVASGIRNTTKAFFWPYAFLGSRAELEFMLKSNFTQTGSKRAVLHISNECFVPFGVSMFFPKESLYTAKFSGDVARMLQSGLLDKLSDEVKWDLLRSSTGTHLAAGHGFIKITSADEKGLTLEDTQGMFLLLAAGFLLATVALISEWMGGCTRRCRLNKKVKAPSSGSNGEHLVHTPRSEIESEIKVNCDSRSSETYLDSRPLSSISQDTLEGQIIHVTDDSILVHRHVTVENWDASRSSPGDVDKELQEIFERDEVRKRPQSDGVRHVNGPHKNNNRSGEMHGSVSLG